MVADYLNTTLADGRWPLRAVGSTDLTHRDFFYGGFITSRVNSASTINAHLKAFISCS